ncbi:MAG: ATP-binding protein [Clostridia bacterium]|nr:ATP-binding protein [Clostridia bacterium]
MKELTLEAAIENIAQVTEFINARLETVGCGTRTQRLIDVAIDELFSNIARYAYAPQTGMATIRIDVNQELRTVEISFLDAGIPYNPLTHEDPVSGLTCKERKEGGFGIYIVKKSMDDIRYEYADGYNVTTIVKKYQGHE